MFEPFLPFRPLQSASGPFFFQKREITEITSEIAYWTEHGLLLQHHKGVLHFFMVVISFSSPSTFTISPPVCAMIYLNHLSSPPSFIDSSLFIAVTKIIMQFLVALLAALCASVVFASPENEKPQGLNLHGASRWTFLRNLFHVNTQPNDHESQQAFKFPSRISRRRHRARYHP